MTDEIDFPRGGKKRTNDDTDTQKKSIHKTDNIFALSQKVKQKTKKRKVAKTADDSEAANELSVNTAENLNFKTAEDGMLVLGCVRSVNSYVVEVDLPGKVSGKIKINNISQHYTNYLLAKVNNENSPDEEENDIAILPSLFEVGQFLPTKIIQNESIEGRHKLHLSTSPSDINANLKHSIFEKGDYVWAAVQSNLDHGYQLDAGIANLRIFLPHKYVKEECSLKIGQPLWCTVIKAEVTPNACTLTVSILEKHQKNSVQNEKLTLHHVIPGIQVDFTITNEVKNGFEGKFLNNQFLGYINQEYLDETLTYQEGDVLKAWLMYLQPITKLSYLTLKGLEKSKAPKHPVGTILPVKIVSKVGAALLAAFNDEKFFIPFKRFASTLPKSEELKEAVEMKYPNGSSHKCRIIHFQYMDRTYIGSFEPEIIKEKYFTSSDVKPGQLVEVIVTSIKNAGVKVKFGALDGFIYNNHLSDVAYSVNIKKHFSEGQKLTAKVWAINDRGVNLTLKPSLVSSSLSLTSYDESCIGEQFPGVITKVSPKGLFLMFYAGISAFLSNEYLGVEFVHNYNKLYYTGQVIKVYIKNVIKGKIILCLDKPKVFKKRSIALGEYVEGVISKIRKNGLEVIVGLGKVDGFVPTTHLSRSLSLNSSLKDTYKVGDVLKELLCISTTPTPILSIMEAKLYKGAKIPKIENLKEGNSVRCYYKSKYKSCVEVSTICGKTLKLSYNELVLSHEIQLLELQPYQVIVTKITKLDNANKKIHVTAKIGEVFNDDYNYSLKILEQYLVDVERLRNHFQQIGSPLGNLQLGQRVNCVINKISPGGCSLFLENNAQGLVSMRHCPADLKRGETVPGVILWINYKEKFVEVSLLSEVIRSVNEQQDGVMEKQLSTICRAQILISQADYTVAVMKNKTARKQLVLVPSYIHENAFINKVKYEEFLDISIINSRKIGDRIVGVDKAMKSAFRQHRKRKIRENSKASIVKRQKKNEETTLTGNENNSEEESS